MNRPTIKLNRPIVRPTIKLNKIVKLDLRCGHTHRTPIGVGVVCCGWHVLPGELV